jgi:hypothetical protein
MKTMDANALLRAYVQQDSEAAFQEIAEDVAQPVFTDLVRKAVSCQKRIRSPAPKFQFTRSTGAPGAYDLPADPALATDSLSSFLTTLST